jgi:[citrate (pro-3S)-lyase] ligase
MLDKLPKLGVDCTEIARLESDGKIISASTVRQAIHDDKLEEIKDFLPPTTYEFFAGPEGAAVRAAIKREKNVIHY